MSEFTKGPWSWSPDKWNGGFSGLFAENDQGVVVPQHRNDGDDGAAWFEEITTADASLIAAAPDLYEALSHMQICQSCSEGSWIRCEGGLRALSALSKVRGGQL